MNDFVMCVVCSVLMPVLVVLTIVSRKRVNRHKEFTNTPMVDPLNNYNLTREE